ncbi:hypothetical protein IV203_010024 [Nitzschia inconspicua]|uniref:RRM domain-containing protein n=1 Tax=Nitzschia inconspicua TaxID=303405 RepID=A0A9K3KWI0_9STRA|nr:hypothetical protein IV203_010024 [Nitzschia inconspicua]
MIKSWADHCSSDEEDSVADDPQEELVDDTAAKLHLSDDALAAVPVSPDEVVPPAVPEERVYDFPAQPPFTAFIGNLSYQIKDEAMLMEAVSTLVKERLSEPVNFMGGRVAYHRTDPNGKHRGFGYAEVETLDQLKLLMTLNQDADAMIAGRKVQLDTANHQNQNNYNNNNRRGPQANRGSFQRGGGDNRGPPEDGGSADIGTIDGSRFRGGKFNNLNRSDNKRRGSNRNSFQNNDNRDNELQDAAGPPAQRPSLKLAPRTKPVEATESSASSGSNIFGGARARDEQAWQQKRASMLKEKGDATEPPKSEDASPSAEQSDKEKFEPVEGGGKDRSGNRSAGQFQDHRQGGRGGRGRGRTGGRSVGGRHDKGDSGPNKKVSKKNTNQQQDKKQQKQQPHEGKAAASAPKVAVVATVPQPPPKKSEPANKFALLMDSDSE